MWPFDPYHVPGRLNDQPVLQGEPSQLGEDIQTRQAKEFPIRVGQNEVVTQASGMQIVGQD